MSEEEHGLQLGFGVGVVAVFKRVRVHNHNPVYHVGVRTEYDVAQIQREEQGHQISEE